jgi:CDP-paratose 2-epimerase
MKVFITGIAGFLGSHCAEYFRNKGDEVEGIDNLTKYELSRVPYLNPSIVRGYVLDRLDKVGAKLVKGDICDFDRLLNIVTNFKPDYIIHAAAQPAMTIALESPAMSCENNVLGTVNVLEVAHKLNIPVAICSTIHIYGNGGNKHLSELLKDHYTYSEDRQVLTGKITPLHADKYADEIYARAFAEAYNMKVATFRFTGLYGSVQFAGSDHGWISAFGIQTLLGYPITIYGTDKQVRDILYVDDAVRAFECWYKKPISGVYNICGGNECWVTLGHVLEIQARLTGKKQDIKMADYRQGDLWYFCGDYTNALETFGWKPKIYPEEGIKRMMNWIKENRGLFNETI